MNKNKTEKAETVEKQNNKGKGSKIAKTVFNVIINILIVLVLITSLLIAALSLTSKADPNGLPNIFGFTFQYVQSNSMKAEPPEGFEGGNFSDEDVIICKVYSDDAFPEIKVGDIITYRSDIEDDEGNPIIITHRVIEVSEFNDNTVYKTKGDATVEADQLGIEEYIDQSRILSVYYSDGYHGKTLKGFADFFRTLRSQQGFFGIILIPMIIFFLYAIFRVVISAMNYRKEKTNEEKKIEIDAAVASALAEQEKAGTAMPADMTEEQMEQFKQFLAFQKAQQSAETPESPAEEPAESTEE